MNNLKHKRGFFAVVLFFLILLVFLIIRLFFAVQASQKSAEIFLNFPEKQNEIPLYQEGEVRDLSEDIYWLEQKLELAKSDSISLIVDLSDSLVQIHLKGMELFHSKILKKYPENVLNSLNQTAYLQLAKVTEIKSEVANVPKKPIKKVKAPIIGIPQAETEKDNISNFKMIWYLVTGENIRIVITGVKMNSDSAFVINPRKDLMKYKTQEFLKEIIPSDYSPTVYLWLNDTDAKAIYRAVPEKGKILFRN